MLFVSDNILVLYTIKTHLADLGEPEQRHLRLASAWILQDGGGQEQEELVGGAGIVRTPIAVARVLVRSDPVYSAMRSPDWPATPFGARPSNR